MEANATKPFYVELPIEVRTYDIDFAGIVSNIVYIRWLEDLRLEIMKQHFPLKGLLDQGIGPVLASTRIDYKRPISLDSSVTGRMWVNSADEKKWTVAAEIVANGQTAAMAEQLGVFVTLADGRPVPMPRELLAKYAGYTGEGTTGTFS